MDYPAIGGAIAAILFGAAAAWRRLARKQPAGRPEPSDMIVRVSMIALIRGIHRANEILVDAADELEHLGHEPARLVLMVAHNGIDPQKTLRSQLKVRALTEEVRQGARAVLDDWCDPRPMVGDYVAFLLSLVDAAGRAVEVDLDRHPSIGRRHRPDGLDQVVAVLACEHDGGLYYITAGYAEIDRDPAIARVLEATAARLRPVIRSDLLRTHDETG